MHPVVGRRIEDEFHRPRQLLDQLGVDEELVHEVEAVSDVQGPRRYAEQWQRQPEEEVEPGIPLLPQRGAEVHVLRGMVRLVGGPAHPDAMGEAVVPVVRQVDADDGKGPRPPGAHRQVPQRDVRVDGGVGDEASHLHGGDREERAGAHQQGRRRVLALVPGNVTVAAEPLQHEELEDDGEQEERDAVRHRVRPRVEHVTHASTPALLPLCSAQLRSWRETYRTLTRSGKPEESSGYSARSRLQDDHYDAVWRIAARRVTWSRQLSFRCLVEEHPVQADFLDCPLEVGEFDRLVDEAVHP
jgi:hypothetical protein